MNNIEQLKQIIENRPKTDASHIDEAGNYYTYEQPDWYYIAKGKYYLCETTEDFSDGLRSLSDIKTIVEKAEEIERLKSSLYDLFNDCINFDDGNLTESILLEVSKVLNKQSD